jgi:L-asparaginase II
VKVIQSIQAKIGVTADDLLCGIHPPEDKLTARRMIEKGEANSPLRHNCSGKHTGMLAHCKLRGWPTENYIDPSHPLQQTIFETFSQMCGIPVQDLLLGTDGCSAPVFAVPMSAAAWAFARLADPSSLPEPRAAACRHIFEAVTQFPEMIAAPGALDTELMRVGAGKILVKSGAEGYLGISLLPGACGEGSPAYGITIKVSDGDMHEERARATVAIEVLHQMGALNPEQLVQLGNFDRRPQYNWRHFEVGEIRPAFKLPTVKH